jgi:hypothetical protein
VQPRSVAAKGYEIRQWDSIIGEFMVALHCGGVTLPIIGAALKGLLTRDLDRELATLLSRFLDSVECQHPLATASGSAIEWLPLC